MRPGTDCFNVTPMPNPLQNVIAVLVRPRFPENIGAAARAVANMGLGGLRVVEPQRLWEDPMNRLATDQGRPVLKAMQVCDSLDDALADTVGALATTARQGERRGELMPPRTAMPRFLDWAGEGKAALVFGPEDRGLETWEVDRCGLTVCIPTSDKASLNLAQAVVVLAYEARCAALERQGNTPGSGPKPASLQEVRGFYDHLIRALTAINVLQKDNPEHFFRPMKNVFDRARMTPREVRALRGVARQVLWLAGQLEEDDPAD